MIILISRAAVVAIQLSYITSLEPDYNKCLLFDNESRHKCHISISGMLLSECQTKQNNVCVTKWKTPSINTQYGHFFFSGLQFLMCVDLYYQEYYRRIRLANGLNRNSNLRVCPVTILLYTTRNKASHMTWNLTISKVSTLSVHTVYTYTVTRYCCSDDNVNNFSVVFASTDSSYCSVVTSLLVQKS